MRIGINFHAKDPYLSGVEYYGLGLINALLDYDHQNQIVVFTNNPDLLQEHVAARPNLEIRAHPRIVTRVQRIAWEHIRLPQLAVKEKLDLLHCPAYICPMFDGGIPYVVTIHDTIAIDHPSWCTSANALYYNAFLKATARKAAAIVCVSQQTAGDVNRNFPFCKDKTHVVYPGIDTAFNSDQDFVRCSQVKLQYHLPDRFILFVGNFEPKKNLVTLIRAYKLLRKMGITHKLVLVGKRSWKANPVLREIAEDQSISSIVCPGYVDRKDLPWVYKLADLFVFISLYEGFGFPPLEAMSCGTCVVSSGKGALGETMGQTACNVAPDDSDQVAQVVYDVLRSDELKKKFILEGKASASAFKWEKTAKEMLGVYQRVLNHSTELAGKATV